MRRILVLMFSLFAVVCFSQGAEIPTRRILAEEIEQGSIQTVRLSSNRFAVSFTYTEAGARKALAFRRAYDGQEVITQVGSFESRVVIKPRNSYSPGWVKDEGEGWLKRRTDKFVGVGEDDAKKIVDGLRKK